MQATTYSANLINSANGNRKLLTERLAACRWFIERHEAQLQSMSADAPARVRNTLLAAIDRQQRAASDIHAAMYVTTAR